MHAHGPRSLTIWSHWYGKHKQQHKWRVATLFLETVVNIPKPPRRPLANALRGKNIRITRPVMFFLFGLITPRQTLVKYHLLLHRHYPIFIPPIIHKSIQPSSTVTSQLCLIFKIWKTANVEMVCGIWFYDVLHVGVSCNGGTPKSSICGYVFPL